MILQKSFSINKQRTLWVRYLPAVTEKNIIGVFIPEGIKLEGIDSKIKVLGIPSHNTEPIECTFKQLTADQIPFKSDVVDPPELGITQPLYFVSWDLINHFAIDWDGDLLWILENESG